MATALVSSASTVATATVIEPNGVGVPTQDTGGGEMRLDEFFASQGEPIDWQADAFATPATFSPLCGFRATLERVDSGSKYGVGWYNADPAATAPPTAVYEIIPQNATPGTQFTGDDIRSSPDYAGGLIGFALIRTGQTPPYHYSEARWNTVCSLCLTPGNWVLALTYQSKNIPNAWYMGFEDGSTDIISWNNDGDFNDSLFLFEGLSCDGSGQPCAVEGASGECAAGLTECVGSGDIQCRQVTQPSAERCDAVDNDCNGSIDDGDGLCAVDEICHRGTCEPRCGRGEFQCGPDELCVDDVCVDAACAQATCTEGQICIGGSCIVPCDGVVCPGDQVCRLGRCVDLCDGVTCDGGRVCEGGVCVESCDCRGCEPGLACQGAPQPNAGHCVVAACDGVTCPDGEACDDSTGGACAPLCHPGVICPMGQVCESGACLDAAQPDAGSDPTTPPPSFGGGFGLDPTVTSGGGGGAAGASTGEGGAAATSTRTPVVSKGPGCGCRVPSRSESTGGLSVALWLGVLALVRRRAHE
jgi:hypothetical protein